MTTATASKLIVDTAGLMALRTQHIQAAQLTNFFTLGLNCGLGLGEGFRPRATVFFCVSLRVQPTSGKVCLSKELGVSTEHDVGTTTSHVRRNGHCALTTSHCNDLSFTRVLLGIQNLVRDLAFFEHPRQKLRLLNRCSTNQNRLSSRVAFFDIVNDRAELSGLSRIDQVALILTNHRTVRRNRNNTDLVGGGEFCSFGLCSTGHTRTRALGVQTEVVLKSNSCQGLIFSLDLYAFLRFDRLVHTVVVAAPRKHTTSVLVNDQDLSPVNDVIAIAVEEFLCADCVIEEADQRSISCFIEVLDTQLILDLIDTGFKDTDGLLLLIDFVVLVANQNIGDAGELRVPAIDIAGCGARDDQRGTSLVDQNRVDLIDNHEVMTTLDHIFRTLRHVVTQVIEAEFIIRTVRNISVVLLAAFFRLLSNQHAAHGESQEVVDASHQIRLVLRQIIVHGHNVNALTGQRTQVGGHSRN